MDEKEIVAGISQGIIIGLIFFQLFVNDLLQLKISGKIYAFAHDTVANFYGGDWEGTKEKPTQSFETILNWLNHNLLLEILRKLSSIAFLLTKIVKDCYNDLKI